MGTSSLGAGHAAGGAEPDPGARRSSLTGARSGAVHSGSAGQPPPEPEDDGGAGRRERPGEAVGGDEPDAALPGVRESQVDGDVGASVVGGDVGRGAGASVPDRGAHGDHAVFEEAGGGDDPSPRRVVMAAMQPRFPGISTAPGSLRRR